MYAMYLRKSRADREAEEKGAGETLTRHRQTLIELAARNGHAIGGVYAEIVSGETIAGRPQMQRLLRDLSRGLWEGVYVMEVERLARGDTLEQGRVMQVLKNSGAVVVTPSKTFDPMSEFDEEVLEFGLFLSRREYKTINRRIQRGRMASLKEGKFIGSVPPFGYQKVKLAKDKGYSLIINEREAEAVRGIFRDFLQGKPVREIAENCGFSPCRIYRMLENPVYCGRIRWGKCRQEKGLDERGEPVTRRRTTQGEEFAGLHEGIVSEGTFAAAQERLGHRCRGNAESLCKGLLTCGLCGEKMRFLAEDAGHRARVVCGTKGCKCVRSNANLAEEQIVNLLFPQEDKRKRFRELPFRQQKEILCRMVSEVRYEKTEKGGEVKLTPVFRENVAPDVCDEFFSLPIFPQNPCASTATTASASGCSCSRCN